MNAEDQQITAGAPQCIVCASTAIEEVLNIPQVPVHCTLLWPTREGALRARRADIRLVFCQKCGHLFNIVFDPNLLDYSSSCDNSLHFSSVFQAYAESLANRLIKRYNLHGKDIVEIGCGQGDFLALLCDRGANRGVGFDPGCIPKHQLPVGSGTITFIQDFYSPRHASYGADLIVCRQVLEHIGSPRTFVADVRMAIGDRENTIVFFEVPNAMYYLRTVDIWSFVYEHCSYFTPASLARLFMLCRFHILDLHELYQNQFLGIEGAPRRTSSAGSPDGKWVLKEIRLNARTFAGRFHAKRAGWKDTLRKMAACHQRVVIWGGGARCVTFLNMLDKENTVEYVVDINPRKHHTFVAGTGQELVPPEFLVSYRPDVVILMNPIYEQEIQKQMYRLGISAQLVHA
jgi:hypothetical protein